ncbi:transforming growth factor beta-1-induced transcript 1 protein isoform X6 [Hyalella azteca]|uniref:Transforming growth factor beta-1-induced transcript 1 protein isoform X6 n=1 Tax=Hyalella azteca TaxID=294128 RepID=A0A8B7PEP8_HYAAZ|nr:transforming growth factor beta-1-induced transcript 1 protein isoform X6 [Hyalella azteca]
MDRTQYGLRQPSDAYRPFDIACKTKPLPGYALLADLQSTVHGTAHTSSHSPGPPPLSPSSYSHHPSPSTYQQSSSNHHHNSTSHHQSPSSHASQSPSSRHHQSPSSHPHNGRLGPEVHANGHMESHLPQNKVYYQESKEEVRTETRSSGPEVSASLPPHPTNELESLLSELNSSRYTGIVDRSSGSMVHNSTAARPSVNSLLNELNSVSSTTRTTNHHNHVSDRHPAPVTASTATRDLDNLMAELSEFKVKEVSPAPPPPSTKILYKSTTTTTSTTSSEDVHHNVPTAIIDVHNASVKPTQNDKLRSPALVRKFLNRTETYAKPQLAKTPAPPPPAPVVKQPSPPVVNELDCMLGTLTSHMTEQGVNTAQKGSCCACSKPIVGQVITALGKTWHPEHFTCAHCTQQLGSKNFFEREAKPYCEACYHELFSPRCAYCNGSILDKCVTALDKNWHPDHFFCAQCGNTFGEEGFHEKDGKAYCREDYYNMFAPKCGGCNSPIMENYISALNAQWHPECFVCRDCRQPFNGGSFFDHEGMPYCETHYHAKRGSLCHGCHKPITGRCVTAMFRKYHPEHFTCSFCLRQLNKGTFKEQNDKPYCHGCFEKLFS